MNRELVARYGKPASYAPAAAAVRLGITGDTSWLLAFTYPSREAAEAFAASNLENWEMRSVAITELDAGLWLGAYDLRTHALAATWLRWETPR